MTKRTLIENNVLARVAQSVNIGKYGLCYMVLGSRFGSSLRVLKLGHERLKKKKKPTEQNRYENNYKKRWGKNLI